MTDLLAPTGLGPDHVVLAEAGAAAPAITDRVNPRRIAIQIAAAVLGVICLVGLGGALVSRQVAQQQAVHDVAELTDVLAQSVLQPALTDQMTTDPATAPAGLDSLVRANVLSSTLVRVKLWTPAGLILYSDEPRLVGRTFDLDDEARTALTVPQTDASVSDLGRPENEFERSQGKLLEVYRPVWTPGGHPLLLETYFRYDTVSERSHGLWFGFAGIILSSLAALLLLLSPIVWSLLRRTRRAQDDRQAMMRRAVESSDAERARIAASLHDGVVQQLVASSLQLAGSAKRANAAGDLARATELDDAAATVRASVGGLRSLLVEIYPPNLVSAGLVPALRDLISGLRGAEVAISLAAEDDAGADLSSVAAEAVYRVVQETLRNAVKHSGAATAAVALQERPGWLRVTIDDDGAGFDASTLGELREDSMRAGHLGLQLITDAARRAGAELVVTSAPGRGTHYRMEAPTR